MDLGTSKIKNRRYWEFIDYVARGAYGQYMGGSNNFTPSFEHAVFLTGVTDAEIYKDFRKVFKRLING